MSPPDRRTFLKNSALVTAGLTAFPAAASGIRPAIEKIRIGIIGTGMRGRSLLDILLRRDDVEIAALCDIDQDALTKAKTMLRKEGKGDPSLFSESQDSWREMLKKTEMDAVIIATPWTLHAPMAKAVMEAGMYAGVEVPVALTLEDCMELVAVSERTGMPCMMLENVCYRRDIMAIMNMVRKNMFGELVHMECGYQHDLREVKFNDGKQPYGGGVEFGEKGYSEARWRTNHALHRNGDFYPTHGIGPVAMMLDINRGNRFLSVSSFATKSRGLREYIVAQAGEDHPNASLNWKLGDVVTSMLQTSNGETVMIQHDTSLPRPYSLGFRVQGSRGLWMAVNKSLHIEGLTEAHRWADAKPFLEEYDHPLWKRYAEDSKGAGHGGMDFFVIHAFVESVKAGTQTPIDVYDSVTWSAIVELSEQSIQQGGSPIPFPDFTGGQWVTRRNTFALDDTY